MRINFISFTVQIYNALHMQGKKGDFWHLGMAPLVHLNPPMAARRITFASRPLRALPWIETAYAQGSSGKSQGRSAAWRSV